MKSSRDIRNQALKYLSRREYSAAELIQKLISRGASNREAVELVQDLQEKNLVCNERFAEQLVRVRMNRGYGPIRIASELKNRGVSPEIISNLINSDDIQWNERVAMVLAKKYRSKPVRSFSEWASRANFLRNRGYTSAQVNQVLGKYSNQE